MHVGHTFVACDSRAAVSFTV